MFQKDPLVNERIQRVERYRGEANRLELDPAPPGRVAHSSVAHKRHGASLEEGGMEHQSGYYLALILTVVGTLFYHLAQKTMPPAVSPFGLLASAFAVALTLCLLFLLLTERASLRFRTNFNWSSLAVGVSVVIGETGYLVAYRSGWKLNRAALTSNVAVAILLMPLGTALFQEPVSLHMIAGAVLCISGLILLVR